MRCLSMALVSAIQHFNGIATLSPTLCLAINRKELSPLLLKSTLKIFRSCCIKSSPNSLILDDFGLEGALMDYVTGKVKATAVVHSFWRKIIKKGDTAIDATCGNGNDTLAMIRMVVGDSGNGQVIGMDIQSDAIDKTASLLHSCTTETEKEAVKLLHMCHSRMEEIVSDNDTVRLVAFNLGYLPSGDKTITTQSETTLVALEAASRILASGGLISLIVYVGHLGGREELKTVEKFASELSVENWICSKFQIVNKPLAPIIVFIFKR